MLARHLPDGTRAFLRFTDDLSAAIRMGARA
jgi:hypothetical protein